MSILDWITPKRATTTPPPEPADAPPDVRAADAVVRAKREAYEREPSDDALAAVQAAEAALAAAQAAARERNARQAHEARTRQHQAINEARERLDALPSRRPVLVPDSALELLAAAGFALAAVTRLHREALAEDAALDDLEVRERLSLTPMPADVPDQYGRSAVALARGQASARLRDEVHVRNRERRQAAIEDMWLAFLAGIEEAGADDAMRSELGRLLGRFAIVTAPAPRAPAREDLARARRAVASSTPLRARAQKGA